MAKNITSSSEIGAAIRRQRKALGLSQEQLAEQVGVSYQQVQRYENGTTTLNVENLQRIANALGIAPGAFFSAEELRARTKGDDPLRSLDEKIVLRLFRKLATGADRKLAIGILRRLTKKSSP